MKRIVVRLSGMPFDPTYEIDDDTVAIGDLVRMPGSNSAFVEDGETGTVIALESSNIENRARDGGSARVLPDRPSLNVTGDRHHLKADLRSAADRHAATGARYAAGV
jgi:hypothetical protein